MISSGQKRGILNRDEPGSNLLATVSKLVHTQIVCLYSNCTNKQCDPLSNNLLGNMWPILVTFLRVYFAITPYL